MSKSEAIRLLVDWGIERQKELSTEMMELKGQVLDQPNIEDVSKAAYITGQTEMLNQLAKKLKNLVPGSEVA